MTIGEIIRSLEMTAPLSLQEEYDNAGLLTGQTEAVCSGALICLDVTEEVVDEAVRSHCNLIVAHHPVIFRGLKKLNGKNHVERVVIQAVRNNIAIYAIHTNLDNVLAGVNGMIADKLALENRSVLVHRRGTLRKLSVYVPASHLQQVESALFSAGAGHVGRYSECSFVTEGLGSFKPEPGANPYSGQMGIRETGRENKIEVIFPFWLEHQIVSSMKQAHPYEEVAFQIHSLSNDYSDYGSGLLGELAEPVSEQAFLARLKSVFGTGVIRHTAFRGKDIRKVSVCGGSGSFLTQAAIALGADVYVTSDVKYHEFFDADGKILLADIGHFESEQYTIDLIYDILRQKFPTFALLKTGVSTNPVLYF